ncbi:MAG TPA: hypothetical protein VKA68_00475, partial [bacterium]|nr:hypothetical protein [bacterium]
HLQDNQVRFVNALSVLETDLKAVDTTQVLWTADTSITVISKVDSIFNYLRDTTATPSDTTAHFAANHILVDSIEQDSIVINTVTGDTLVDSTWQDYIFITDSTYSKSDTTSGTTTYATPGAQGMRIQDRVLHEDSSLVAAIDIMVDEGDPSVSAVPFMGASGYMEGWPVGQHTVHLQALSDENTYREIIKRDTTFITLAVQDTGGFFGEPPDGFADIVSYSDSTVTWVYDIETNTTSGDTVSDSLVVTFPSDRKATILLHSPTASGTQISSYTDNYISSGPVDVNEEAEFALLRAINATSAGVTAIANVVAGSDTTVVDTLGFTGSSGYEKFENVGSRTLYITSQANVFDPDAEEYVDMAVEISEDITLEANKRYTAFIFQDGMEFFIEVMVDDE